MIDHPLWVAIQNETAKHAAEYIAIAGAFFVAAVCTMPRKCPLLPEESPLQEVWSWLRDTLQTAVPAARANNNHTPPPEVKPTPPAEPANPQK
jgi:hypothetical protein